LEPQTQTTVAERAALGRHAANCRRLIEIGVFNGVSTLTIRNAMAPDGVLWAVDPFYPGQLGFNLDEHISKWMAGRSRNGICKFLKQTGTEAANTYRVQRLPPVDFVFIDADHTWKGIEADWSGWGPLIGAGGVVALHDSRSCPDNPITHDSVRYTNEVIRRDPRFEVIDEVDTLTVLRATE